MAPEHAAPEFSTSDRLIAQNSTDSFCHSLPPPRVLFVAPRQVAPPGRSPHNPLRHLCTDDSALSHTSSSIVPLHPGTALTHCCTTTSSPIHLLSAAMEVVQAKAVLSIQPHAAPLLPAGAPQPKRRRHRYIDLACDGCRARKKRCDRPPQTADGSTPSCSQCLQSALPCIVSSKARNSKRQQCQQSRQGRSCSLQQQQHRQQQQQSLPQQQQQRQPVIAVPLVTLLPRVASASNNSSDEDEPGSSNPPRSPSPQTPPRLDLTISSQSFASTATASSSSSTSSSIHTSPSLQPQSPTADAGDLALDMPCLISSISAMSFPYSDEPDSTTSSNLLPGSCGLLTSSFAFDGLSSPIPYVRLSSPSGYNTLGGCEDAMSSSTRYNWNTTAMSASTSAAFSLSLPQQPAQSSRTSSAASSTSSFSSGEVVPVPAFCLQSGSSLYIDTYLSLVNAGLYKYLDDTQFRSSYFEHHIAHSSLTPPGSAWLLCVSAVMAIGARMHGNVRYSDDCAAVARHCARLIRSTPPSTMEDCALAYRALLVLSYYSAAMLCRAEVEWLAVAESLLFIDGARALIPASVIHLHHLQPSFADVLDQPSDAVCDQVVKQQMDLYAADRAKYLKCKRLLRQQSSVAEGDEELVDGEQQDEQIDISADLASSSRRCQPETIEQLNRSLYAALSTVHRRPSLCFSVFDCLITLLCAEAAVLQPPQRCTIYGMKLNCYVLLGCRKQAVRAARDLVQLVVNMRQANSTCLPPFALTFIRSIAILNLWDDSYDTPCLISSALRIVHAVAPLWPATQRVEAQLLQRLRDASRLEMADATSGMSEVSSSRQQHGASKSDTHHGYYQYSAARLQRAMNKEMALQALTAEWDTRRLLPGF